MHFKDIKPKKKHGINKLVKKIISPLIANGLKNIKIIDLLKNENKIEHSLLPSNEQLNNYRFYYKSKKINEIAVKNKKHFLEWIDANKFNEQTPNNLFVIDYALAKDKFIFILSSISLLKTVIDQSHIMPGNLSIDATYKLINCKFPLIIIGCEDLCHQFHCIGFSIVSNEDKSTYTFILATIKNYLKTNFNFIWDIKVKFRFLNNYYYLLVGQD